VRPAARAFASLIWAICLLRSVVLAVLNVVQVIVALALRVRYDHWYAGSILVGAIDPVLFWLVSASAALAVRTRPISVVHRTIAAQVCGWPRRAQRLPWFT
jgi:hypothetical protein